MSSAKLANRSESRRLLDISDDLAAFSETLDMLQAQLAKGVPDEEKSELEQNIQDVQARLSSLGAELAGKADAVAIVIRRLAAERDFVHAERDRLKAKEAACERAEQWLRKYVVSVMQEKGIPHIKTAMNSLFLRSTESVEILDANAIPDHLQNAEIKLPLWLWHRVLLLICDAEIARELTAIRVKAEPSLSAIRKTIKSGVDVAGADMKLSTSLVVR